MSRLLLAFLFLASAPAFALDGPSPLEKKTATDFRALGYEAQVHGKFQEAVLYYERAITFSPEDPGLLNDLGLAYEASGESEKALNCYLKALSLDYKCLSAYANLAYFYEAQGKLDLAAYYFSERVRYGDPDDPKTLQAQVKLDRIIAVSPRLMKQKIESERQALEKEMAARAGELNFQDNDENAFQAEMAYQRGLEFFKRGRYAEAKGLFEDCLRQDPEHKPAQNMLDHVSTMLVLDPERSSPKGDSEDARTPSAH